MKSEITVTRTPGEIPHEITLTVELDKEGVVLALPVETVFQRVQEFYPKREAWVQYETDTILAQEGFPFELEPDEIEEAKKAIASNQIYFPLAALSPHQ